MPGRHDIELPLRGPLLRDRYVLRLIAVERAFHVLLFGGIAVAVFVFVGHRAALRDEYTRVVNAFYGASGGGVRHGLLGSLQHFFLISPAHLYEAAGALTAYAVLEAIECVGLWRARRWAEYLTFVATVVFVPFEIYELTHKLSVFKILATLVNLAVAAYLLLAKRLFGARGGQAAEDDRRRRAGGWEAIERASPPGSPRVEGTSA